MGGKREEEEEEEKSKKKGDAGEEIILFCSHPSLSPQSNLVSLSLSPILKRYEANAITNIYLDVYFFFFLQSREWANQLIHSQNGAQRPRSFLHKSIRCRNGTAGSFISNDRHSNNLHNITIAISADHLARYIGQETRVGF